MNKTNSISIVVGIALALGVIGTAGCITDIEAPWCGVFKVAADKYEEVKTSITKPAENVDTSNTQKANIVVSSPKANEEVGLPLIVKGEARVFENSFNYRLKDEDGKILHEGFDTALAPDIGQFGPFEVQVNYPEPKGEKGTLEVFSYSAKDGSEINKVTIPLKFKEAETRDIKIFLNQEGQKDCDETRAVARRISESAPPARSALEELFRGPTPQEFNQGLRTSINSGVQINSLIIEKGEARVDFNDMLQAGVAGSCRVRAIQAQIEDTLKQFSTVNKVTISIDGKIEGILQP